MAALEVKAGQKIKASQYNELAQSVSIQNGSNQTPFRATKEGMLFNGGATSYDTKAKSQNYKLLECRIGRGLIPEKFENAGSEFYGAFVNVAGFLQLAAFTANSQAGGPQVFEGLYIKDPTSSTLKLVGFDIIGLNQTPSQVGFQNCSNIWCPVSQLKWDEPSQMFKGGVVYLRCLQLFNSTSEHDNGATVLVLDDGFQLEGQAAIDEIINAIRSASGYKAVNYVDAAMIIDQHQLFTPMESVFDSSKPADTPYTMFDGTATLVNNSDSAVYSKSMLHSLETTAPEQYGMDSNGQLSSQTFLRGSHSNSLYHFGQYHSDLTAFDWASPALSAVDVLVKIKYPHPNQGTFPAYDDRATADLAYVTLSAFAPGTVDSEISDIGLSSVQTETWTDPDTGNDIKYHQLFGFERGGLETIPPLSDYQDSLEVVLRDSYTTNGNGARVNYVNLSTVIAAASGTQTDAETTDLSSINRVTDSNALQLLDFDKGNCVPWEDLSSKPYADLVIRRRLSDGNPATKVDYIDFKGLMDNYIWKEYIGDSQNWNISQRSIDIQPVGNDTNHYYAMLYNITSPSPAIVNATLKYGETRYVVPNGTGAYPNVDFQIVCRDARNGIEVKYDDVGIYLPKPSVSDVDQLETTLSGIVGQISAVSVDISANLSSMLSNYWKCGGTYSNNCYGQSIGDDSQRPQIDLNQGLLMYSNVLDPTVDWHNCFLMWNGAEIRLKWADCIANDRSQMGSIDWHNRILYDSSVKPAVDWENRVLKNVAGSTTIDWKNYYAKDVRGSTTIDWNNKVLRDGNGTLVDWGNQLLVDGAGTTTVEWSNRFLYDADGTGAVDWNGRELLHSWKVDGDLSLGNGSQLKLGSTTLNETQLQRLLALI